MMKGGENVKDNQRKEISIRNLKLSEVTSRNRCIHSRIDVRAMSVKGKLVRIKMSHTNFDYEYRKRDTAFDSELFANEKRRCLCWLCRYGQCYK